jgi:hypothetical protein
MNAPLFYFSALPSWAQKIIRLFLPAMILGLVITILAIFALNKLESKYDSSSERNQRIKYFVEKLNEENINIKDLREYKNTQTIDFRFWPTFLGLSLYFLLFGSIYMWLQNKTNSLLKN